MAIYPEEAQVDRLLESGIQGSVRMLNLLKFKDQAEYEDGTDGGCANGMEAYLRYGAALAEGILEGCGATMIYSEPALAGVIGDAAALDFDVVAIVDYPSVQAFLDMTSSPAYLEAARHREAGLESQLLICCSGNPPAFGSP